MDYTTDPLPMVNMDEKLDRLATLTIDGKQLQLLKLENPQMGQKVRLEVDARITAISVTKDSQGVPSTSMTFDLDRIAPVPDEVDPMDTIKSMYPSNQ